MKNLGNGVLVDDEDPRYFFYYKPLGSYKENNGKLPRSMIDRAYKCVLKARYLGGAAGRRLVVDHISCRGGGGGDGKILMCTAITFLQEKLDLDDDDEVSLLAMADVGRHERGKQGKNEGLNNAARENKLVAYYTRTYGFKVIHSGVGTDMVTTIGTIKAKCAEEGGGKRRGTRRKKRA
jgi:hypothetical protein